MALQTLKLTSFRNIGKANLKTEAKHIFLVGENGQGKTSLLESIYMLSYGGSFRTKNHKDVINNNSTEAIVWGYILSNKEEKRIGIKIGRREGKRIVVNKKEIRDRSELIKFSPSITFTHEDLHFLDGSPVQRRTFFDQTLSLFNPSFIDILRRYKRILKARNSVLRNMLFDQVVVYDSLLLAAGIEIQKWREKIIGQFSEVFRLLCKEVGGIKNANLLYKPSWKKIEKLDDGMEKLLSQREQDKHFKTTTTGPHRDDFIMILGDKRFKAQGSTGQQRVASLILRVAQAEFFYKSTKKLPILLIDDVLLELDAKKREAFLKHLPPHEQAFFTFLPDEPYQHYQFEHTNMYKVKLGQFEQCNMLKKY